MLGHKHVLVILCFALIGVGTVSAQQAALVGQSHTVKFNVQMTDGAGKWVTGLHVQDFTVMDEGTVRPITSFRAVTVGEEILQYEVTFDPAGGASANEYHHVEVRVNKPGLTIKTRRGYYAIP